ncbi:MAG: Fic family protein [Rhodospirillales bacterium]|nr:Fic family protein [Rhodospirillales bacterium]
MLGINKIKISPALLLQVTDIDEFKGLWRGLDRHTTGLQLLGDVADYGANFKQVLGPLEEHPITIDMIRVVNASQLGQKGVSDLKTAPNQLPISHGDKVFGTLDTAEPEQVEPILNKLCEWINESLGRDDLHPLLVAAVFAAVFLQLAPFDTGNLRTVRFMILLIMLKSGYTYAPYASLTPIMEGRAEELCVALKNNQESLEAGTPDWDAWLAYFFGMLQDQKETLHERLYAKEVELCGLSDLSVKIMALFKEHKRLQMKEIIKLTNGRRATIKLRLQELADGRYLVRHGAGRGTWYALT